MLKKNDFWNYTTVTDLFRSYTQHPIINKYLSISFIRSKFPVYQHCQASKIMWKHQPMMVIPTAGSLLAFACQFSGQFSTSSSQSLYRPIWHVCYLENHIYHIFAAIVASNPPDHWTDEQKKKKKNSTLPAWFCLHDFTSMSPPAKLNIVMLEAGCGWYRANHTS